MRRELRWARILVQYKEALPACVRIGVGGHVFSVPIWAETTAFCQVRDHFNGVGGRMDRGGRMGSAREKTRGIYASRRHVSKSLVKAGNVRYIRELDKGSRSVRNSNFKLSNSYDAISRGASKSVFGGIHFKRFGFKGSGLGRSPFSGVRFGPPGRNISKDPQCSGSRTVDSNKKGSGYLSGPLPSQFVDRSRGFKKVYVEKSMATNPKALSGIVGSSSEVRSRAIIPSGQCDESSELGPGFVVDGEWSVKAGEYQEKLTKQHAPKMGLPISASVEGSVCEGKGVQSDDFADLFGSCRDSGRETNKGREMSKGREEQKERVVESKSRGEEEIRVGVSLTEECTEKIDRALWDRVICEEDFEPEPIMCTPLAVVVPEVSSAMELLTIGESQEDISFWVKRRAKGFGKFLGVSCLGFEDKIMDLVLDIEKKRRETEAGSSKKGKKSRVKRKRVETAL